MYTIKVTIFLLEIPSSKKLWLGAWIAVTQTRMVLYTLIYDSVNV